MGKPGSRTDSKSKAEGKFEKKLQFYNRVADTVVTLNAQKAITKKKGWRRKMDLKAFNLSSLSKFLPNPEESFAEKVDCKTRLKFVLKERKQMDAVFKHPAFQADPLRAIHLHLERTQRVKEPKKTKTNKNGSQKRKEKKLKATARPSSMEI